MIKFYRNDTACTATTGNLIGLGISKPMPDGCSRKTAALQYACDNAGIKTPGPIDGLPDTVIPRFIERLM